MHGTSCECTLMKPALLKEAEAASEFRILILELAPAVAADLTSFLASLGYQVVGCARCLEEGVDLVVELHPGSAARRV